VDRYVRIRMQITIKLGPVTILDLKLFHTEAPAGLNPNVVILNNTMSDEDDDEKDGPGDMFGGGKC
jgi:hypothetical protein